jgi:hypothetical protein
MDNALFNVMPVCDSKEKKSATSLSLESCNLILNYYVQRSDSVIGITRNVGDGCLAPAVT